MCFAYQMTGHVSRVGAPVTSTLRIQAVPAVRREDANVPVRTGTNAYNVEWRSIAEHVSDFCLQCVMLHHCGTRELYLRIAWNARGIWIPIPK